MPNCESGLFGKLESFCAFPSEFDSNMVPHSALSSAHDLEPKLQRAPPVGSRYALGLIGIPIFDSLEQASAERDNLLISARKRCCRRPVIADLFLY